jgi:hypothetical protein
MNWEELERSRKDAEEKCRSLAKELFPKTRYNVKRAWVVSENPVAPTEFKCMIDFVRKDYSPDIDCESYCEGVENYRECVRNCRDNLKSAIVSSVKVDLNTRSVEESSITGLCEYAWGDPEEDYEEFEKKVKEFEKEFKEIGCDVSGGWIHSHEIASLGYEVEEEYPAICYYHPKKSDSGCKIDDVLKLVEKKI